MGLITFRAAFVIVVALVGSLFFLGAFGPFGLRYNTSPMKCQFGRHFITSEKTTTYALGRLEWVVARYGCPESQLYDTRVMKPVRGAAIEAGN